MGEKGVSLTKIALRFSDRPLKGSHKKKRTWGEGGKGAEDWAWDRGGVSK